MTVNHHPALRTATVIILSIVAIRFTMLEELGQNLGLTLAVTACVWIAGGWLAWGKGKRILPVVCFTFGLFFVVWSRFAAGVPKEKSLATLAASGRTVEIHGYVDALPQYVRQRTRLVLNIDSAKVSGHVTLKMSGKVLLQVQRHADIQYGEEVRAVGRLILPRNERNPGEFDYQEYLRHRGIYGILLVQGPEDVHSTGQNKGNFLYKNLIYPAKQFVLDVNRLNYSPETASMLNGLLVGVRQEIDSEVLDTFSKSGTIHILSISGLHVAFVAGIVFGCLTILRLPFRGRIYLTIGALIFYAAVADFVPSVSRATVMITIVLLGQAYERQRNTLNSLFSALILILLFDPRALFEVGLQLSFMAVLAILVLYPRLEVWAKDHGVLRDTLPIPVQRLIQLFLVSVAAQLGTLPLSAYYFHNIPLMAMIANVVVVPLAGLIMGIGFLTIAVAPLSVTVAHWYAGVNAILIDGMTGTTRIAVQLPLASYSVFRFETIHALCYYLLLVCGMTWQMKIWRRRWAYVAALGLCVAVWSRLFSPPILRIVYLDVDQGDASVVLTPGGRTILIDGGDRREHFDYGKQVVVPFLKKMGIKKLDYVIASHPHDDHIGGLPYVLREFPVDHLVDAGQWVSSSTYLEMLSAVPNRESGYIVPRAGDVLAIEDDLQLYFLHPTDSFVSSAKAAPFNTNNVSIVMQLRYRDAKFLWMGDAERKALASMRRFGPLIESQVIKVSHHGSWNGTDDWWLSMVRPSWAILSCGFQNKFGHPSPWVVGQIEKIGARVIRTDEEGAVQFYSDGSTITRMD